MFNDSSNASMTVKKANQKDGKYIATSPSNTTGQRSYSSGTGKGGSQAPTQFRYDQSHSVSHMTAGVNNRTHDSSFNSNAHLN